MDIIKAKEDLVIESGTITLQDITMLATHRRMRRPQKQNDGSRGTENTIHSPGRPPKRTGRFCIDGILVH